MSSFLTELHWRGFLDAVASNDLDDFLCEGGGVYVNNERQTQVQKTLSPEDLKWPGAVLLRAGKKNYHLVRVR